MVVGKLGAALFQETIGILIWNESIVDTISPSHFYQYFFLNTNLFTSMYSNRHSSFYLVNVRNFVSKCKVFKLVTFTKLGG